MRVKFAVKPTPCAVATMETNRVMKPETRNAARMGASAAGMMIFFMAGSAGMSGSGNWLSNLRCRGLIEARSVYPERKVDVA
jgi:hypothetical protein